MIPLLHRIRIAGRQFANCLSVSWKLLVKARASLLIMLAFPVVAVVCTVEVAGADMFANANATSSGCFFLVCACIWGGLFNSVQLIVKQRDTLQADMAAGLYPSMFMAANALVQLLLCAVQAGVLCVCFPWIKAQYGHEPPGQGRIIDNVILEYYVTFLLLFYAADALGLVISTLVKKAETASVITPYILIVQLIFSGLLFPLQGVSDNISYVMESRWGMEALAVTSDLNYYPDKVAAKAAEQRDEDKDNTKDEDMDADGAAQSVDPTADAAAAQAADGTEASVPSDAPQSVVPSDAQAATDAAAQAADSADDDADADDDVDESEAQCVAAQDDDPDPDGIGRVGYDYQGKRIEHGGCYDPKLADADYDYTTGHLWSVWAILGAFAVVLLVLADILVHRYKSTRNLGRE